MAARSKGTAGKAATKDVVTQPMPHVIDPENFTPRLLALLSNALVWRESHEMRRLFGLGTNDWRIISALAVWPGSTSGQVSDFLGVNKAVVSKSVNTLGARSLITLQDGPRGSRPMYLTAAGAKLHDDMMPISMSGQDLILEGLTPKEASAFNATLRGMLNRVRAEQESERNERSA